VTRDADFLSDGFIPVFEDVGWLTVQYLANGFERTETNGFGFTGFKDG
jgi:hypothetical protein